ncbi:MAG: hypothetical protein V4564_11075 [Pseudomonadota bacterium]|uniref:putative immunity protein n=1 Tax=Sphingomonas sp. ERG5 TaxID=1381597 RepID=UPI00054B13DE|nr:hypothetical protein [Sphingomonas sp. ERG5]
MNDHQHLALWAADCAERVLALFETQHPEDTRAREAVRAVRLWQNGDLAMTAARIFAFAAHAAAREAGSPAAAAAARAAGHAAATAHVATHAPHAAAYALKAIALMGQGQEAERDWQRRRLPPHLRNLVP